MDFRYGNRWGVRLCIVMQMYPFYCDFCLLYSKVVDPLEGLSSNAHQTSQDESFACVDVNPRKDLRLKLIKNRSEENKSRWVGSPFTIKFTNYFVLLQDLVHEGRRESRGETLVSLGDIYSHAFRWHNGTICPLITFGCAWPVEPFL